MNWINTLTKETPDSFLAFCHVRAPEIIVIHEPGSRPSPDNNAAGALTLDFPASIS